VYVVIKNRPRLDKINPKAYIGHLIGYDSTNIFWIWLLHQNKVISTRDVTFDKSEFYDLKTIPEIEDEIIETIKLPSIP
jgi:hypothetical protein